MKKTYLIVTVASLLAGLVTSAQAQVVTFSSAADITNNFREIRSNTNDPIFVGTAGSDGVTNGYANLSPTADSGAVRLAYDANGATAGTSTFTTGFVAMDVRWTLANQNIGLFFGPTTTDAIGWSFRLDNSGALENSVVRYGINNTNNFTTGTTLTTSSGTAFANPSGTPAFTTTTDIFASAGLTAGNWYSMRMDFGLNGSNERTLQFQVWNNILDSNGVGTGSVVWNQSLNIVGTAYNGAGEVGIFAVGNAAMVVDIDNFTATASAIPEPSTYAALAGLGVLGLAAMRRRRAA